MAAIAASVGLIPGLAQAADPLVPGVRGGIAVPDADVVSAKTSGEVFTSPGNRTVRSVSSSDKSRSVAPSAEAAPEIRLTSWSPSAHGVVLRADFQSGSAPLNVTIAWGDGSQQTVAYDGSTHVGEVHKYAEVGKYTITVTVTDPASGTQAVNKVDIETWGGDYTPHAPLRLLDTRNGTVRTRARSLRSSRRW
ncbi:hypothetical protein AB0F11_30470 [Streptomyces sp. NPDC032472]|uniref:PKD domain-containing protein n=1 Tax=Streptomyces sp. NPDC032472 TaxID=3155018 RepID=UPI0033CA8027